VYFAQNETCTGGPAGLGSCPVAPELDRKKASRSPGSSYSIEARLSPIHNTQCTDSPSSPQTEGSFSCLPRLPDSTNGRCRDCSNFTRSSLLAGGACASHGRAAGTPAERTHRTGAPCSDEARGRHAKLHAHRRDDRTGAAWKAFKRGGQGGRERASHQAEKGGEKTCDRERRHGRTNGQSEAETQTEGAHGMGRLETRCGPRGLEPGGWRGWGDKRPTARHIHMSPLYGTARPGQLRVPCPSRPATRSYPPCRPPVCFKLPLLVGGGYSYCTLVQIALECVPRVSKIQTPSVPVRACLPLLR